MLIDRKQPHSNTQAQKHKQSAQHRTRVFRFRGVNAPLSNFYPAQIKYRGREYSCVEQAYQHLKAVFHEEERIALAILKCTSARTMKSWGDKITDSPSWTQRKEAIMRELIEVKVDSCPEACMDLVDSADCILVESVKDDFWGSGAHHEQTLKIHPEEWPGENKMGVIWMDVRRKMWHCNEAKSVQACARPCPPPTQEAKSDQACARPCPPPTQDGTTINNHHQTNTKSKVPLNTYTRYQSRADSAHTIPKERLDFIVIGNSNARGLAGILRNNGYTASGTTLGGANIRAIDEVIRTRSPTAIDGKCIFIQALDVDLKDGRSPAQMYKDIDNLIEGAEEAYPTSHIILSGPPKPKAQQEQNINNQFTSYIRHKLSGKPRMCLLDNGMLSLRDNIHFTSRAKQALCNRLSKLTFPKMV